MGFLKSVSEYVDQAFAFREPEKTIAALIRQVTKWYLEFVRNILVVSGLSFLALISHSTILRVFAGTSAAALLLYLIAHVTSWQVAPFPYIKNRPLFYFANIAAGIVVYAVVMLGSIAAAMEVFGELVIAAAVRR